LVGLARRLMVVANGQIAMDGPTQAVLEKLRPAPLQKATDAGRIVVQEASNA
jgi:ABC-type molybdate transport system ATPase subunit